ncbi:hypothetical protein [Pleionea sp. CnH1-48]|uniref:hypothetical protein n=1 Tax=Pleionea sp. CnH1-48 TaxID=2954494 RepID=UPI0020975B24|nr:hypothetical protein [Pleionea sp. CnH1-48]MCO7227370.1 hypothetical protein [Pleionea sp. CnH1-48]
MMSLKSALISIVCILTAISSFDAYASKGTHVSIELSFKSKPVCKVHSGGKKASGAHESYLKHDENTISWSAGCAVKLPKKNLHCVLTGQSIEQQNTFVSWGSQAKGGMISASIESDADINPSFGAYRVSYFCH